MKAGLLEHLRVFVAIARAGSLTAAADAVGAGQPTVSRQLAALEKHLGGRLLQRSTRFVHLTDKGRSLLPHAESLVAAADATRLVVQDRAPGVPGRVRVACSNAFGRRVIMPALAAWQREHPLVHLELLLSDAWEPVIKKGIDVAIRLGALPSSSLVATRIGASYSAAFASADYVKRHGTPDHPRELAQHACIRYASARSAARWTFVDDSGKEHSVAVAGPLTLTSMDALQDAVLGGLGIALLPTWFWLDERQRRRVVRLFPSMRTPPRPVMAVAGSRYAPRSNAAAFVEFVRRAWRPFEGAS
jgi:DNA-binding transcriptional LysR family regulator